jgi:hypothetical protein
MGDHTLQNDLHLINELCADIQTFSYHYLTHLALDHVSLEVDVNKKEIAFVINNIENYQGLLLHLIPNKRFYQLLSLHFRCVHLVFGTVSEPIEKGVFLDTILLGRSPESLQLRDHKALGARLRRALNIALQGHIGVLQLNSDRDFSSLRMIWQRGRVTQLLEGHGIVAFDDEQGLIKLWKPRRLADGEQPIAIVT